MSDHEHNYAIMDASQAEVHDRAARRYRAVLALAAALRS